MSIKSLQGLVPVRFDIYPMTPNKLTTRLNFRPGSLGRTFILCFIIS